MRRAHFGRWGEKLAPYVLLAPYLFTLIVFFGYAFVRVFYFSFTDYNLFGTPQWVGLRNYIDIFREVDFTRALKNSLTFMIIVTACQTTLALVLAVILNQRIRGIRFFRAAYYLPSVASSVVITLIFMWFFQRRGVVNFLTTKALEYGRAILVFLVLAAAIQAVFVVYEKMRHRPVSVLEPSYAFLALLLSGIATYLAVQVGVVVPREVEPVTTIWFNTRQTWPAFLGKLAFPIPLGAVMIFNTWTTAPTFMLLYLAGLQDIPKELYEAAAVDGARRWHTFRYIIVPQLKPITFLVVTMGLIGTLQMFDQVAIMGEQAPIDSIITLAFYVYRNIFPSSASPKVGMASAAAIFLACLTLLIVLIQKKVVDEKE